MTGNRAGVLETRLLARAIVGAASRVVRSITLSGRPLVVGPVEPEVADWFRRNAGADEVKLSLIEEEWSWGVRSQGEAGLRADLAGAGIEPADLEIGLLGCQRGLLDEIMAPLRFGVAIG